MDRAFDLSIPAGAELVEVGKVASSISGVQTSVAAVGDHIGRYQALIQAASRQRMEPTQIGSLV